VKQKSQIRASHSKKYEKGFARPEIKCISKKYLCRSDIKNKGFARLVIALILRIDFCR